MSSSGSFTGRTRHRKTSPTVRWVDLRCALIGVGGIGTIVAVLLVCVFLVAVAIPLFGSATLTNEKSLQTDHESRTPVHLAVNDYRRLGWALFADGQIRAFRLDNGRPIGPVSDAARGRERRRIGGVDGAFRHGDGDVAFGFADGTVRTGKIDFDTTVIDVADAPEALRDIAIDEVRQHEDGVATLTPKQQIRLQKLSVRLDPPTKLEGEQAKIVLVDYVDGNLCSLSADGKLQLTSIDRSENPFTGEVSTKTESATLAKSIDMTDPPAFLRISGLVDNLFVTWTDGRMLRMGIRNLNASYVAEEVDLIPEAGVTLTSLEFMIGRTTLLAGDSSGQILRMVRRSGTERRDARPARDGGGARFPERGFAGHFHFVVGAKSHLCRGLPRMAMCGCFMNELPAVAGTKVGRPSDRFGKYCASRGWRIRSCRSRHVAMGLRSASSGNHCRHVLAPVWYEGYPEPASSGKHRAAHDKFEPSTA